MVRKRVKKNDTLEKKKNNSLDRPHIRNIFLDNILMTTYFVFI